MQILFALPFLASGCIVFIVCASILRWRRFALPASLWCVALGPSFLISMLLIGLIYQRLGGFSHSGVSRYVLITAGVLAVLTSSIATFVHSQIVTFFSNRLFRVYVTGVSFGVGILFASLLVIAEGILSITMPVPVVTNTIFILLTGLTFAGFVFRRPSEFRAAKRSTSQLTIPTSSLNDQFSPNNISSLP
jgi:hypothetical protein